MKKRRSPNISPRQHQQGFTLIEMAIASGLMVTLVAAVGFVVFPYLEFAKRKETDQRIRDLVQATRTLYAKEAANIASDDDGKKEKLQLSESASIKTYGCTENDRDEFEQSSNLAPLMNFTQLSSSSLAVDGHKQTVCVAVSPMQYRDTAGARIYYRSIAYISPGENGVFDPSDEDKPLFIPENPRAPVETATGAVGTNYVLNLNPNGDDVGGVMDGFQVMVEGMDATRERLNRLKDVYQTYFKVGYLANASRNMAMTYFFSANGQDDRFTLTNQSRPLIENTHLINGTGIHVMTNTTAAYFGQPGVLHTKSYGSTTPLLMRLASEGTDRPGLLPDSTDDNKTAQSRLAEFGLAPADLYDGWGRSLYFDNSSNEVRSPLNKVESRRIPPFTARFVAGIPAPSKASKLRTLFSVTAIGVY